MMMMAMGEKVERGVVMSKVEEGEEEDALK